MSRRGIDFLNDWMAEHLPDTFTDNPAATTDLADEMMTAAEKQGISRQDISEEVGSVFQVILEAMQNRSVRRYYSSRWG
ncbi:DUF768 domain-containing protein [Mesorhizobium sp. M7A.F.Ca.MR.176.00.0.0]|uniref:DUF768 domain-containing protein n=1 Tax=Mesorhizobium sp. M7A.F.Ca.MR.176.00.0.0 TaxID=2496776 RepID=UPI000FD27A75|nr:DUF768 domain-containing protein [Mesorhizobium sp. M7A.F.Ca.MR.176.00.0.0]RUU84343.1 DUF768 domain-containing protein [Mesorhizobium sp. M7A.F.Ca.MR.176.00.0.0]